jgi:hypothetical protein
MILRYWKRRGNLRYEDKLLLQYARKRRGTVYAEVPIGINSPPSDSERRYLDGVRIPSVAQKKARAEIITYTSGRSDEFREAIAGKEVEVIEVKRTLNRPVIGQVSVGQDVFQREYRCAGITPVIVCSTGDGLLEAFCKRNDIRVRHVKSTASARRRKK